MRFRSHAVILLVVGALAACAGDDAPDLPDVIGDCPALYAQDLLPTFELDVAPADWAAIQADYAARVKGTYYPAVFRHAGETVSDTYIRLRGRTDNWIGTKMQLQISFNRVDKDARFHGLRKLMLDASPWDHSLLRERVALAYLRDAGQPAPCANNARLVVNGAYLGLYSNVENADREYLERIFARPEGDLFAIDGETFDWELETNEDESNLLQLNRYLEATELAEIDRLTNLDASVAEWAAEAMVPHAEGYVSGAINFLLYDHPARGFTTLAYDLDSTYFFDDAAGSDLDQADPLTFTFQSLDRPRQVESVLASDAWRAVYIAELREAMAAYDVASLQARVDTWAAQIAADVAADPNRSFSDEEHAAAVAEVKAFLAARRTFMDGWLAAR